jgi:predicted Zn finger-like uncharacterized protein
MPQLIPCAECNKRIRVPDDMLGKRVKCPNCGATFVALGEETTGVAPAPAAAPVAVHEFDDAPAPKLTYNRFRSSS